MSIFNHFQHLNLSQDQSTALVQLENFLINDSDVFLLKGYAGSGKTTILKGLIEYLEELNKDYVLMAPTGRAAKVIREKTGKEAFTIHKSIYSYEDMVEVEEGDSFFYYYKIRNNLNVSGKIFIVDEASMVSNAKVIGEFFRFGSGQLLNDLMTYIRISSEESNTKIIFVGDSCQLPPIGDNSPKAFDIEYLTQNFNIAIEEVEMKEVKRQQGQSGILRAASKIRKSISSGYFNDFNLQSNGNDIINPSYDQFWDIWERTEGSKIIIASKNKTCLELNNSIRLRKYGDATLPVQRGDIMIIGGNNYGKGIFNGEFAVISDVGNSITSRIIHLKGKKPVELKWRYVELVFPDKGSDNKVVKGQMLENFLYGDNYLEPEEIQALYVDFTHRNPGLKPKSPAFITSIVKDEYFNCLLLKYGYAITCHKAQGGEWDAVFTIWDNDNTEGFDFFTDVQKVTGKTNSSFYRWAYTAITRASKKLYALNPPFFNSYSSITFLEDSVITALESLGNNPIQAEEITIDDELLKQLNAFQLLNEAIPIQDHFIKVRHAVRKKYIEISNRSRKNMEIFYTFIRDGKMAGVKTWINKDNIFNEKYLQIPKNTNNQDFYSEIESLLSNLPNVFIKRNTSETILGRLEFEEDIEEKLPFTRNLFDDLNTLFENTEIIIFNLEHLEYKERYTFVRYQEEAIIDFEYNGKGFFGRVLPIKNKSNSLKLIADIQTALKTFK